MKQNHSRSLKLSFLLAVFGLVIHAYSPDWPGYRGASHDATTTETIGTWPKSGLRKVWKAPTPKGFSSFAVAQGKAVTLITENVDGADREVCIALDANSGKRIWATPIGIAKYDRGGDSGTKDNQGGDGPRSTPVIDGKNIYTLSADLVLSSINADDGKMIWKKDIIKEHAGRNINWRNAASPVVDGNLIFMAGGGAGQALLAFNKQNGALSWKTQDDEMTHSTPVIATIHGVKQIIFLTQKGLVSLVPETGKLLWRQEFDYRTSTAASPVVAGDIVYCSAGYGTGAGAYQVNKNGNQFSTQELWRLKGNKLANHWSTPVEKDGYLYGMFQFKEYGDGPIKCVELRTGREMWSEGGFGPGNVILVGNQLVALGDAGQLVLINPNPQKYTEVTRFDALEGKCWSTPAFSNGRIYVRSSKEAAAYDAGAKISAR
ncbi:MAG: PQQ-binding-like beta-propeller repeat protein [Verrucomicrobiales bacterium]